MSATAREVLALQRRAERERVVAYEPAFTLDAGFLDQLSRGALAASDADVGRALRDASRPEDLAALLSPAATARVEELAAASRALTVRRFGRTVHLFAPLYLSNECVSECTYCGFQVWNRDIVRRTLSPQEVAAETRYLRSLGFRHVLLVAGEHPKHVSASYVRECISAAGALVPNVSVEVQAWDEGAYEGFVAAGCDGVVVYQETYDARVYPEHHLKGNKRFFGWRLGAPERAAAAGMRRLGIGALLGLNPDWRFEVLALAAHARFLMRRYWRCDLTVALPRLEPAAGLESPPEVLSDVEFVQALCALRLALPDAGIVVSTREPAALRDGLAGLGVTHMSAGSRTEPGGYSAPGEAEQQFAVSDHRTVEEVALRLREIGLDPVWKDASPVFRRGGSPDDRL